MVYAHAPRKRRTTIGAPRPHLHRSTRRGPNIMSLLTRFDPPAYVNDFDAMPGMREAWHDFVSMTFDQSIASEQDSVLRASDRKPGIVQFYNPTKYDPG